ncbi:pyridoxal phosphate phosphatase PHOSPHO2 isoform X2 [Aethina tumida]|nr:pyridoxal phosphate phosphatase PHOSPHO2 isoform X2 [Aethina tumida]
MALNLIAFDFDHTIVDDNTDTVVAGLLNKTQIPESVKTLYRKDGWTAYMQEIFKLLHQNKVSQNVILNAVKNIKPVNGVKDLIQELHDHLNCHVIIISDSNTLFIECWLKFHQLDRLISKVFSNPARFDSDGMLHIEMYHVQDNCKLSSKNLCKGQILQDFLNEQEKKGIKYAKTVYCGDGTNDFCPILRLNKEDIGCVRNGYRCIQLIQKTLSGQKVDDVLYKLKCNICEWNDCYDILNYVKPRIINEMVH